MPELPANMNRTLLTIDFQGLCAFVRDREGLEDTTEATVLLMAAEDFRVDPRLCVHTPVLIFEARDLVQTQGTPTHTTALVPGSSSSPRPALGIWPLRGRDLRVVGAGRGALMLAESFGAVADLHGLTGRGQASRSCLDPHPPADRIIAGRVALTSGWLSAPHLVGEDRDERWVFADETASPTSGDPERFAQEIRYELIGPSQAETVALHASRFGREDETETLTLFAGARVAISNLCPTESTEVTQERDFLAYYATLAQPPGRRLIPHRLRNANGALGVRVGLSACPPGTTFFEEPTT